MTRCLLPVTCAVAVLLSCGTLAAAPGDQAVKPLPPSARLQDDKSRVRTAALPARGLFVGDQLSDSARARLAELIVDARDLRIEVALLVPTGPWQIDGSGRSERDLTPARLESLRRFLGQRGVDPKRIFVESRVDASIKEPQLTVQLVGQPASD
ncbi:MAG: hypothetical protein Q7S90_01790 [Rubrivivax sp.]|nr:hypothetical protein [Rubrivivax sp.]